VENAGHTRRCVNDDSEHYPRTDPAVIMLVVDDDDRLLLGRQVSWPERRFSTLAGFVEPGESLEAAVRREVHEEAGITVDAVTYLGSQPWPFPSSLMLGFTAHARDTAVDRRDGEIAETRWYTREGMLADIASGELLVSPSISISRRLIEHWYGGSLPENPTA
jgi:NAD+ diphosphatase